MKTFYIHTINGRPGTFDGNQICYATFYGKANTLCSSLEQIKKERRATMSWRSKMGFGNISKYGHLRFSLHEQHVGLVR